MGYRQSLCSTFLLLSEDILDVVWNEEETLPLPSLHGHTPLKGKKKRKKEALPDALFK